MSLVSFDSTLLNLKKCDKVKRTQNCLKRSSKVVDFATNGKPMYDFLLNNSNSGPISHCFRDTTTYGGIENFLRQYMQLLQHLCKVISFSCLPYFFILSLYYAFLIRRISTLCLKSFHLYTLCNCQILTDFHTFCIAGKRMQFATKLI